jgi:hypothetical protein
MAKQDDNPLRALASNWPALTALAVALFGVAIVRTKIESPRPTVTLPESDRNRTDNAVPARLWQDPLTGSLKPGQIHRIEPSLKPIFDEIPKISGLLASSLLIDAYKKELAKKPILFLFIYVDSSPTPEAAEIRRRERYATLSGLNTAGYVPVRSDQISYVRWDASLAGTQHPTELQVTANEKATPQERDYESIIPYEWMQPYEPWNTPTEQGIRPYKYQAICLLWIKDKLGKHISFFSKLKKALETEHYSPAANLKDYFLSQLCGDMRSTQPRLDCAIAGRLGSGQLLDFFSQDAADRKGKPSDGADDIPIYITNSTAPRVRKEALKALKRNTHFLIGTDQALADALMRELQNRGLQPGKEGNNVAIVSEWDTEYGRSMFPVFRDAILNTNPSVKEDPKSKGNQYFLFQYSYLARLDGKFPEASKSPEPESKPQAGKSPSPAAGKATATSIEGDPQVDYIRRLVDRMKAEEKPFRAIGIVGSDVYDKWYLLQALKPSFPEALFFTTDLDVRLFEAQSPDFPSPRNLVIASHFGLSLNDKLQKQIAPFRSSYDTASYIGCLAAVGFFPDGKGWVGAFPDGKGPIVSSGQLQEELQREVEPTVFWRKAGQDPTPIPPRLYEVARKGWLYELSFEQNDPIYSPTSRQKPWIAQDRHIVWVLLGLIVPAVVVYPISRPWQTLVKTAVFLVEAPFRRVLGYRQRLDDPRRPDGDAGGFDDDRRPWLDVHFSFINVVVLLGLLLGIVLAVVMYFAHTDPNEEPVEWLAGISVWPGAVLRLIAAVLCAYFIADAFQKLKGRNEKIDKENHFAVTREEDRDRPLLNSLRKASSMWAWKPPRAKESDLQVVWSEFKDYGRPSQRWLRCLLIGAFYLVLFLVLYSLFDHTALETRGPLSRRASGVIQFVSQVAFAALVIFVLDCTVLCYRFLNYLASDAEKKWPVAAEQAIAAERGLTLQQRDKDAIDQVLLVRLMDATTNLVARLLYAPFTVLLVLVVAQSEIFDHRTWNAPLLLTVLLNLAVAVSCAVLLQRSAKKAKEKVLGKMDQLISQSIGRKDERGRQTFGRIKEEIANMQSGAFASFYQNPVLRAILIPLGGGGSMAALEMLLPYL